MKKRGTIVPGRSIAARCACFERNQMELASLESQA